MIQDEVHAACERQRYLVCGHGARKHQHPSSSRELGSLQSKDSHCTVQPEPTEDRAVFARTKIFAFAGQCANA